MGASQSKKNCPKAVYRIDVLPLQEALGSGDFQKAVLNETTPTSNKILRSKEKIDELRAKTRGGMPIIPPIAAKEACRYVNYITPKNHSTPMSSSVRDELNIELLFDMLRSHCDPETEMDHTRLVTTAYGTRSYADTRIQYPPKFHDLDVDILLEILRYYVACQTDGVFILMLLSTAWSEFVLNSPILWQWITIDSLSPDWVEKAGYCHALSAAYPLQIILRLPITESHNIIPFLAKCVNLFVEVPDYIPNEDVADTRVFLDAVTPTSCLVHWYRASEAMLTESRETITADLSGVTTLRLDADGSEHPQYHRYAQTRDIQRSEHGDVYHPLVLLKPFHVLQVLQNAYYLRHLVISHHSIDPIFLDLDLPVVTMFHLQLLEMRGLNFARNGALRSLVQSLRCPALSTLSLSGKFTDVIATAQYCNIVGHPDTLRLCIDDLTPPESQLFQPSNLLSVISIHVTFLHSGELWEAWDQTHFHGLIRTFHGLLRISILCYPDKFSTTSPILLLPTHEWRRLLSVKIESQIRDRCHAVINYAWDATRSTIFVESSMSLTFDLLDILRGTREPATVRLGLNADKAPGFRVPLPLSSVKTLHLRIVQSSSQLQTIQDIRSLLKVFPRMSAIYFNIPPALSQWLSPYPMLSSTHSHKLQILAIGTQNGNSTVSFVDYTMATAPSATVISGVSSTVMEFARVLASLGSLVMTGVRVRTSHNDPTEFHCLRVTASDVNDRERLTHTGPGSSGSAPFLSLRCVEAPLYPNERISLAEGVDQTTASLYCLARSCPEVPPGNLGDKDLLGRLHPGDYAIFQVVDVDVGCQRSIRSTTDYRPNGRKSIMSISGTCGLVIKLLRIVQESSSLPLNLHAYNTTASLVLSPRSFVTCLHLNIKDQFDGRRVLECAQHLVESLPDLWELHFAVPSSWRRSKLGPYCLGSDRYRNLTISIRGKHDGVYILPSLGSSNEAKGSITVALGTRSVFWEFAKMLGNIHGLPIAHEALREEYVRIFLTRSPLDLITEQVSSGANFIFFSDLHDNASLQSFREKSIANCVQDNRPSLSGARESYLFRVGGRFTTWGQVAVAARTVVSVFQAASFVRLHISRWVMDTEPTFLRCIHCSGTPSVVANRHLNCFPSCRRASKLLEFPQESRVEDLDITIPSLGFPCEIVSGTFTTLTTIRCTPYLLLPFLSLKWTPKLHTVYLHFPVSDEAVKVEWELAHFDMEITRWLLAHHAYTSNIRTLGISWFPDWRPLLNMLRVLSRKPNDYGFTLELPNYPHALLQWALERTFQNVAVAANEPVPGRISFVEYCMTTTADSRWKVPSVTKNPHIEVAAKPCYYCSCSRIDCRRKNLENDLYCSYHSQTDLVRFRRDIPSIIPSLREETSETWAKPPSSSTLDPSSAATSRTPEDGHDHEDGDETTNNVGNSRSEFKAMSYPQDRYASQPPPPGAGGAAGQGQSSSPWNPNPNPNSGGAPAPPPRPPSNPAGGYAQTSYQNYPTYQPQGAYNSGYDNPYGGYYDQPAYDNPNSLYTSTGQVVSSQQLPTPTTYPAENPFLTPGGGNQSHPSLYNDAPTMPTSSSAQSGYGGGGGAYPANELGFNTRPQSSVNPDRYNTPAPLPGTSSTPTLVASPPLGGRKKVQLTDGGPASLVPGFPPTVGSRASRYGDAELGDGGDAAEMALLGPPGGGRGHGGDRFSVGGFDPGLLGDDDDSNIKYGRIPQRVPRRYKTKKRYELFHGNLVIDNEVPSKLLDMCPLKAEREFKFMRYTAATCDPNDFKSEGYTLRPAMYEPARKTELFIVLTMYNEDEELFCRSMSGVMKNIQHLITRERSKTWGKEGWKKVVVCIVSDGRSKINSRTLSVIAAMGCYQDGVAKNAVNGKPVTAHIYEYTSQISVTPPAKIGPQKEPAPIQLIFCLKEKNQKKINSHRWFFNAFGPVLEPNVCVLLDVGTMPGPTSIYHLWKSFDINSNVGGACGEIVALKGKWGINLLVNPLVAAQNFEYKMSNILDKPLESVFGYITVLPGAFSAYRYIALQNDPTGEGPLQKYFLGETMHGAGADIFTANMYLAEDRILCWELVSKRGGQWILHYVKSAYAETDVPDNAPELISQRRRWLNGSFFAAVHSTVKFNYIYRSSHTTLRKFWIHVELVYQVFNLIFSWFGLANFYIAFAILSNALEDPSFGVPAIKTVNIVLNYFYLGLVVMCYLLALGNRPQGSKKFYVMALFGFAGITVYMTFLAFFLAFKSINDIAASAPNGALTVGDFFTNAIFRNIVVSMLATLGLYIFASLLFFEPWHMITSFIQYLLLAPSYITVLNVYAFANVHDVSWGTKGDNKVSTDLGAATVGGKNKNEVEVVIPTEQKDINAAYDDALHVLSEAPPKVEQKRDASTKQEDYYRNFRTNVLLAWTLSNGLLGAIVVSTAAKASDSGAQAAVKGYMTFILISVAGLAFIRFCGSSAYMLIRLFAGE